MFFPSYLPHAVQTNDHDEENSISFNVDCTSKVVLTIRRKKRRLTLKTMIQNGNTQQILQMY